MSLESAQETTLKEQLSSSTAETAITATTSSATATMPATVDTNKEKQGQRKDKGLAGQIQNEQMKIQAKMDEPDIPDIPEMEDSAQTDDESNDACLISIE